MNIYNYLKKDHRKVADLMEQVVASSNPAERASLFIQIDEELSIHAETEEQTFYAALEQKGGKQLQEKEEHAEEEHEEIKEYLSKLRGMEPTDDQWLITFGSLKHAVEHHVDEEEGEIFEKARKVIPEPQAVKLAAQMDALKQKYKTHAA